MQYPIVLPDTETKKDKAPNCRRKRVALVRLHLVRESSLLARYTINSPEDANDIFRQFLGSESDRELCALLCLDTKNRPTTLQVISIGTLDSVLIHPREVFKTAIIANAASIICAHWHPSGDPEASAEDVKITYRLTQTGAIIGITLLDHLIMGSDNGYLSLKESGLMDMMKHVRVT
ncbi:JAB domain-containing protein [Cohnella silvisoli]|uniref:JAB domain-containing protein n=1 Tax=Cohnella silvisoli TaxID=2873699 RepID=A0ABV1KZ83_9BACL|nr:JAB domain-containing protein [Cohnella silvisoli]MCD9024706.1 DNA repair protein RadC [Cohnella silvisoli]